MTCAPLPLFVAFIRNRAANAAVEFAILTPILLLLVAGTIDLGLGFQEKLKLQSALNSGLQHVMQTSGDDTATTHKAIEHGLASNSAATIEVEAFCRCSASAEACVVACASGGHRFASGSVSSPYRTLIFGFDMTLDAHFEVYVGQVE